MKPRVTVGLLGMALGIVVLLASSSVPSCSTRAQPYSLDPYNATAAELRSWALSVASMIREERARANASFDRLPVVLIPSLIGNRLEAAITFKPSAPSVLCARTTFNRYLNIWLGQALIPFLPECWLDNLKLSILRKPAGGYAYESPVGVKVRPEPGLDSCLRLVPYTDSIAAYLHYVEALESLGWVRDRSIFGVPYDWREPPDAWFAPGGAYDQLKSTIEKAVGMNGGRRAILLALSMGSPVATLFLGRHVTPAWKEANIARVVSLSGALGGSIHAAEAVFAGTVSLAPKMQAGGVVETEGGGAQLPFTSSGLGLKFQPKEIPPQLRRWIASTARSWGSLLWLLPNPIFEAAAGRRDRVVIVANGASYTVNQTVHALADAGDVPSAGLWQYLTGDARYDVLSSVPGVELICIVGSGVPTATSLGLQRGFGHYEDAPVLGGYGGPRSAMAMGDGTVSEDALRLPCDQWPRAVVREFPGLTHAGVLAHGPSLRIFLHSAYDDPGEFV